MSLLRCRECSAHISSRVDFCVHCGIFFPSLHSLLRRTGRASLLILLCALATGIVIGREGPADVSRPAVQATQDSGSDEAVKTEELSSPAAAYTLMRTKEWSNLRAGPGPGYGVVGRIPPGEVMRVQPGDLAWRAVYQAGNRKVRGYVYAPLVEPI